MGIEPMGHPANTLQIHDQFQRCFPNSIILQSNSKIFVETRGPVMHVPSHKSAFAFPFQPTYKMHLKSELKP
jgi:hypothetical protein